MLRRSVSIGRALAHEFRVPSSKEDPARDLYSFNVLIRLATTVRGRAVEGVGEACPRGADWTGPARAESWQFLESALEHLHGVAIGSRRVSGRADVVEVMDELRSLAAGMPNVSSRERPHAELLAGLDMALVDLAAKGVGVPMAVMLGGRRRPVAAAGVVRARWAERELAAYEGITKRFPIVKFAGVCDLDQALHVASLAAASAGSQQPIWIEFAAGVGRDELVKLAELLADRILAGELPAHVVVQSPAGGPSSDDLAELQTAADEMVPHDRTHPGLVTMSAVRSADEARELVERGVRGVDLCPQRLGGMRAVLDVASELHRRKADVRVGLSALPHMSGIGARAMTELASSLRRLDYCAIEPAMVSKYVDTEPPLELDSRSRIRPGRGAGLGAQLKLASAVQDVTCHVERPSRPAQALTYEGQPANSYDLDSLMDFADARGFPQLVNPLIDRAALARGLNITRLAPTVLLVDHPELAEPIGFTYRQTGTTGMPTRRVTNNKDLTKRFLEAVGVPVPRGAVFEPGQHSEAIQFASLLGGPAVVKPRNGTHGIGVTTDLRTAADVRSALAALAATTYRDQQFVVEQYIAGNDYRFLVVGDRVVSVVMKRPALVVGDGRSTVVDLVLQKNQARLQNPHTAPSPIRLDHDAAYWLQRQGMTVDSVPASGDVVRLGSAGNVAVGGDSVEVTGETHESLCDIAIRATQAVPGVDHAGIDLMGDHQRSADQQVAAVIEVNVNPGTGLNHFPFFGTPRDVSDDLVVRECQLAGLRPGEPRDELCVRIQVDGKFQWVAYREWFERMARSRSVAGSIRQLPSGSVEAVVAGRTDDVWVLASRAIAGPRGATVDRARTTHVADAEPADRFEVRG